MPKIRRAQGRARHHFEFLHTGGTVDSKTFLVVVSITRSVQCQPTRTRNEFVAAYFSPFPPRRSRCFSLPRPFCDFFVHDVDIPRLSPCAYASHRALTQLNRCGSIKAASNRTYLPMPCPVREGQAYYVDKPIMVITRLPPELSGVGRDSGGDGSSTEGGGADGGTVILTGVMTHSKDRGLSGVRAFLTFTLDKPAMVGVGQSLTIRSSARLTVTLP